MYAPALIKRPIKHSEAIPGRSGQSGVHHPLSPVIGLGLPNQRKKERKERTQINPRCSNKVAWKRLTRRQEKNG